MLSGTNEMKNMGFDDRGPPRGGDRPPREMFDAVCADCGKTTQVPFKPTPGRPVYCRDDYPKHAKPRNF